MRKVISLCLAFCIIFSLMTMPALGADTYEKFSGSGTSDDPFLIQSEQDFYQLIDATNENTDAAKYYVGADGTPKYFKVTKDLDMKEFPVEGTGIGITGSWGLLEIKSHFDGDGHTVSNLSFSNKCNMLGVFGQVAGGSVKNFIFDQLSIKSTSAFSDGGYVGLLIADTRNNAKINDCTVKNSKLDIGTPGVNIMVGGIVGNSNGIGVTKCTVSNNTFPDFTGKSVTFGYLLGGSIASSLTCYSDRQPIASNITPSVAYTTVNHYNVGEHGKLLEKKKGTDITREVNGASVVEALDHYYTVVPEKGYTSVVTVNGSAVTPDENNQFTVYPAKLNTITVQFIPEGTENPLTNNTVTLGKGGSVIANEKKFTTSGILENLFTGGKLSFSIQPEEGMVVDTITYNGESLDIDATSVTVVKDAQLVITFKKDPSWSTTENDPHGNFSGRGTSTSPFLIQTEKDFYNLIELTNENTDVAKYYLGIDKTPKYFKFIKDLDMKDYPIDGNGIGIAGKSWGIIGLGIASHFDGNGHTIQNLEISNDADMVGLFGQFEGGSLTNLTLDHFKLTSSNNAGVYVGFIAADIRNGSRITNVSVIHSALTIPVAKGMRVGGIVGNNNSMPVSGCSTFNNSYPDFSEELASFGSILGGDVGKSVRCYSDVTPIAGGNQVGEYAAVVTYDVGVCGSLLEGETTVSAVGIEEQSNHTYTIVPEKGYTYYLLINGEEATADSNLQFSHQPTEASEIKVVFIPEGTESIYVDNSISVGQGGKMIVNGHTVTKTQELTDLIINDKLFFTIIPDDGKTVDSLIYGGEEIEKDADFVPIKKDALLEVTFKDVVTADSELYVALDGKDTNDGSKDAPFATLEKARDTIRLYKSQGRIPEGGITVYLREGTYYPTNSFTLTAEDSGTKNKPITYAAYPGEKVIISGGKTLDWSKFEPVSDEMKNKLRSKDAKNKVVMANLEELGMVNPGKYVAKESSYSAPMILFDGELMQLARYPNSGMVTDWLLCDILNRGYVTRYPADDYRQGEGLMKMKYSSDVIDSWTHHIEDLIFGGYWAETWFCEYLYGNLDQKNHTMEALDVMLYGGANDTTVGASGGKNRSFYVLNVFEEIDEPGEWYIDRHSGMLYMYPMTESKNPVVKVTSLNKNLIELNDVSYITVKGMELTSSRQNGVSINGGNNVTIDNCEIDSFELAGVVMTGGTNNGVKDCHIHHVGTNFINIASCGDRATLTHCNNYVKNNEMNNFAMLTEYSAAIRITNSVGTTVSHNEIYEGPYIAIQFGGSENVFEYNIMREVVTNATDVGAIYTGRDWRDHGNIVRYNHFLNLGSSVEGSLRPCGFFSDDGSSDTDIYGNVFGPGLDYCQANKIHAGQNNRFFNNLYIDTPEAYYCYMWTNAKWTNYILGENVDAEEVGSYHNKLLEVNTNPLYIAKWPWLANTTNRATIQNESNTFKENLLIYVKNEPASRGYVRQSLDDKSLILYGYDDKQTNTVLYDRNKELFENFDGGDYTLAQSAYPENFPEIPFDMIGRIENSDYEKYLELAKKAVETSSAGTQLGDYSEEAIEKLKGAIKMSETMDKTSGATLLKNILDEVEASRILSAVATENHYTLPEMLEGGQLEVNDVTDGFELNVPGKVGETVITGSFGTVTYSLGLESGTTVTPKTMSLSSPKTNSANTTVTDELVALVGTEDTQFSKPVRMVLHGMGKKKVFAVQNGALSLLVQMKEDTTSAMKKEYGYVRDGADLILWMKKGGEIVVGSNVVLPSVPPSDSDTPDVPNIPNTPNTPSGPSSPGSGGVISSGGLGGGSVGGTVSEQKKGFADIEGHWAEKYINEMAKKGIVSGVTETTFEPDRDITRAEFAALVVRSINITVTKKDSLFKDVSEDVWYADSVAAAVTAGLVSGYDGYFRPDDPITREEMAVVIMKAYLFCGKTAEQGNIEKFDDYNQISDWAKTSIAQALGSSLISGMSETIFAPQQQATRAQATTILKRLLDN